MSDTILILTLLCGPMSAYHSAEQCYMEQNEKSVTVIYRHKCYVVDSATGKLDDVYQASFTRPFTGKKRCVVK